MGCNDSKGVILSLDGTTPGESFCARIFGYFGTGRVPGYIWVLEWSPGTCGHWGKCQG